MRHVGIYDQVTSEIQDVVAPALHELRGEIHAMRGEMQSMRADIQRLDQKIDYMKGELRRDAPSGTLIRSLLSPS